MSNRRMKKVYSEELKRMVVNSVENEGIRVSEASMHYKIPERSI